MDLGLVDQSRNGSSVTDEQWREVWSERVEAKGVAHLRVEVSTIL